MAFSQYISISLVIVQHLLTCTSCMKNELYLMFETVQRPINKSIVTDIQQVGSLLHCAYKCQRRSSESLYFNDSDQTCYCNNDSDTNTHHDPDQPPIIYGGYRKSHEPTRTTSGTLTTESAALTSTLTSSTPSVTTSELGLVKYENCIQYYEAGYIDNGFYEIYIRQFDRYVYIMYYMTWSSKGPLTIIKNRNIGTNPNFYRNWSEYVFGFGNGMAIDGFDYGMAFDDYWLGLEIIASMTNADEYGLEIYMVPEETWPLSIPGDTMFRFDEFKLNPDENYRMTLAGPAVDNNCLYGYNAAYFGDGQEFSTFDRDNDQNTTINCAEILKGAWWFKDCEFQMNGPFINDTNNGQFMTFPPCWGSDVKLQHTQMGIFRRNLMGRN